MGRNFDSELFDIILMLNKLPENDNQHCQVSEIIEAIGDLRKKVMLQTKAGKIKDDQKRKSQIERMADTIYPRGGKGDLSAEPYKEEK